MSHTRAEAVKVHKDQDEHMVLAREERILDSVLGKGVVNHICRVKDKHYAPLIITI